MRVFSPLLLLVLVLPGASALAGCDSQQAGQCTSTDQFAIEDVTPEGTELGEAAQPGQCVKVRYVGRLADGSGTFDEGTLSVFVATSRGAIAGFTLGVNGQKIGQTRRVTVPPNFGYGAGSTTARDGFVGGGDSGERYVGIPSCSTLEFDITVTGFENDTRRCL